jgi:GNAT superfamily N-acetyltransferase
VVKKMYVAPAYRQRGVARALMRELIACARERGVARLVLDTARDRMQGAYALYLALGFRECEPYGHVDYRCPTFMELRIE